MNDMGYLKKIMLTRILEGEGSPLNSLEQLH